MRRLDGSLILTCVARKKIEMNFHVFEMHATAMDQGSTTTDSSFSDYTLSSQKLGLRISVSVFFFWSQATTNSGP
jgi:hypothetical protein